MTLKELTTEKGAGFLHAHLQQRQKLGIVGLMKGAQSFGFVLCLLACLLPLKSSNLFANAYPFENPDNLCKVCANILPLHPLRVDSPNSLESGQVLPQSQDPNAIAGRKALQEGQRLAGQNTQESHLKAIENYEEAVKLFHATHENRDEAIALFAIHRSYVFLKQPQKGIEYAKKALPLLEAAGDNKMLSQVLINLGFTYIRLGEHQEALNNLNRVLPLVQGDPSQTMLVLNGIALAHGSMGHRREAVNYFEKVLALQRAAADPQGQVVTLGILGTLYFKLGEPAKALESFNQELPLVRQNSREYAALLGGIGEIYRSSGEKQKALDYYDQALKIMKSTNYVLGEVTVLNNMGLVYDDWGHKQQALDYFNQALQLARSVDALKGGAPSLNNMGAVYSSMNEYQKALDFYVQAQAVAHADNDKEGEASTLTNIGSIYLALHKDQRALQFFEASLPLFQSLGDRSHEGIARILIGSVYESADAPKALEYYSQAETLARTAQDPKVQANALEHIASANNVLGQREKALDFYNRALLLVRDTGNPGDSARILHGLGVVYENSKQFGKASEYFETALSKAREAADRQIEAETLGAIGSIHEQQGNLNKALECYEKALDVQEKIRTEARLEEFKVKLAEQSSSLYVHAVLINMHLGRPVQAFNMSERARARAFLDQMGNARVDVLKNPNQPLIDEEQSLRFELASLERQISQQRARAGTDSSPEAVSTLQKQLAIKQVQYENLLTNLKAKAPEYASIFSISPLELTEAQKSLERDTTLLSYFVTPNSTLAFVITRSSFKAVEIPINAEEMTQQVVRFRGFADLDDAHPRPLRELYRMLLGPIEGYIKTRRVGIIPHRILHYVPFSALLRAERYFGEDHEIFYLPSVSLVPLVQQKRKSIGHNLLALGLDQSEGRTFLRHAAKSAEDVARLFGERPLMDSRATETAFRQLAGTSNIVFIAAHGELNIVSPLFSHIVLASDSKNDGLLEVHEIYGLDLKNVGLVALSGCETELGEWSQGDDVIGLNRAFIYAGTSAVVASLWSNKEQPTSELMVSFFKYLRQGFSKSQALQKAQSEIRGQHPHPYYWAGFVLTGDPTASIPNSRHRRK